MTKTNPSLRAERSNPSAPRTALRSLDRHVAIARRQTGVCRRPMAHRDDGFVAAGGGNRIATLSSLYPQSMLHSSCFPLTKRRNRRPQETGVTEGTRRALRRRLSEDQKRARFFGERCAATPGSANEAASWTILRDATLRIAPTGRGWSKESYGPLPGSCFFGRVSL